MKGSALKVQKMFNDLEELILAGNTTGNSLKFDMSKPGPDCQVLPEWRTFHNLKLRQVNQNRLP